MHSAGAYGSGSGLSDEEIDGLIKKGIDTVEPEKRRKIYHRIQELYYERAMGLPLYQPTQFRAYRDWVKGYIPHPMLTDANEMFWNLSK
jgi:peptide/nickel transport system substrate-binding protein